MLTVSSSSRGLLDNEDGCTVLLWNVSIYLPVDRA